MKKTAIFDLDGTLLYTLGDLAYSTNTALKHFGYPEREEDEFRYFVGDGAFNQIKRAMPSGCNDEEVNRVLEYYLDVYAEHWHDKTKPYDDVYEMLNSFKQAGIPMAVVSNKPHERTIDTIKLYFPDIFTVVIGQKPGVPIKPDPASVNQALSELGGERKAAFYLGDTGTDIKTAVNAEIYRAGALWGFRDERELREAGANVILTDPSMAYAAAYDFWSKNDLI